MKGQLAVILMGSGSDMPHAKSIIEWLDKFGIGWELRVASAHKTPGKLLAILEDHERREGGTVYITIAGLSNALSGMVDFSTVHPVIACPPPSESFSGADIFSSLRMPPGVVPATILDPKNAALFAAKIFAAADPDLRGKIVEYHQAQREKIDRDEAAILAERGAAAQ
jgi:5-(carboxyamino)imidazole ribonucleotide mutase/phosphoribosylaminoimidazole-succinocarboxamide synthase